MKCPNCGESTKVVWSFSYPDRIARQRQCKACRYRFPTEEHIVDDDTKEYRKILKERKMNKVILIGRLTHDVELSQTPNGIAVAKDSIAVQRTYSKDETDFIPIVCWRKTAEFLYQYAKKGDKIAVTGELNTRKYETKEGEKRTAYEVTVDRLELLTPPAKEEKEEWKKEKPVVVLQETLDDMSF